MSGTTICFAGLARRGGDDGAEDGAECLDFG
jgi:hypothetical protein